MPADTRARRSARTLPVSAVLFDLDGTLADSAGDLAAAVNRMRAERGLATRALAFGIVTNKATRFTQRVVAALGLDHRAGAVVSGDTTSHPKPHPAPLLHAAALLRVAPEACVYVGDDLRDVTAGNAAGMATIVAEYGYLGEQGCADDWPATGWIDRPLALLDWLPSGA
jgi:HAD superfamily hydrolase (TIGR01662 family)